jgi:hypothetical protein
MTGRKPGPLATPEEQAAAIAAEFPGWEAWQGLNGLWHGRLVGSVPIVMVHDESSEGIRKHIRERAAGVNR